MMEDKAYRTLIKQTMDRVMKAFDDVDPDLAEAELNSGALSIKTPKGKIVVSAQPPVKQLWLANATEGLAAHFDWDAAKRQWLDDKQKGFEFFSLLSLQIKKATGLELTL